MINTPIFRQLARFIATVALLSPLQAGATSILPLSLEQMSQKAELIIYGTVREVHSALETDNADAGSGRVVTWTSFDVIDVIKGEAAESHTIKQIGGQLSDGRTLRVLGVPKFRIGTSYVVFLPAPSKAGFSSPIGLHQGSFMVREIDGVKTVSNGGKLENSTSARAAAAPLATSNSKPGSAQLNDFLLTVRTYAGDRDSQSQGSQAGKLEGSRE